MTVEVIPLPAILPAVSGESVQRYVIAPVALCVSYCDVDVKWMSTSIGPVGVSGVSGKGSILSVILSVTLPLQGVMAVAVMVSTTVPLLMSSLPGV